MSVSEQKQQHDCYSHDGEYFYEGNIYDAINDCESDGLFTVFVAETHRPTIDELLRNWAVDQLGESMQEVAYDLVGESAEEYYPFEDTTESELVADIREVVAKHWKEPNFFHARNPIELTFNRSVLTGRVVRIASKSDRCLAVGDAY